MAGGRDARRAVNLVAFAQAGYFTAAEAKRAGYSYQAQKYHADAGNWLRLERGLYRLPEFPVGSDDSYVRWVVWSGGVAVVSHDTAMAVHGLSDIDPTRLHLTVPRVFGRTSDSVVLHVAEIGPTESERRTGWAVTTPLRTLLDAAATDLSQELIDGAVHDALAAGRLTRRSLRRATEAAEPFVALRLERALAAAVTVDRGES